MGEVYTNDIRHEGKCELWATFPLTTSCATSTVLMANVAKQPPLLSEADSEVGAYNHAERERT